MPTLAAMTGGPITTVAPTTTATALSSIATGLTPAEHGLLGYRMLLGGEVLNVLRWTSAGGDRRRAYPPRDVQPFAAFLGHDVPVISPAELQTLGVHRGPPARLAPGRLAGRVGDRRRGRPPAAPPASASSTPTTAASTRRPTSAASASSTTPSCAPPTASSATSSTRCRRAPCSSSPPTTARSTSATTSSTPTPTSWRLVAQQSGEGRFRWWHARHGAADDARQGGRRALRGRGLGRHPGAGHRRALVRPDDRRRRSPPASATSPSSPTPRSASTTPPTPGRSRWSAATAR